MSSEPRWRSCAARSKELSVAAAAPKSTNGCSSRRSTEEYKRVLESLMQEVEHLSRLSDQLLMLARADSGALVPAKEPIDVADFLHESSARWEDLAKKQGTWVEVSAPSSGRMEADPALLRRVVDNLMENAVRHTARGTAVTLRGRQEREGWSVEVEDQGSGVAVEHRVSLFTRFGRAENVRSPENGGAGFGLALSAAIARAHGGSLELVEADGTGAVFRLYVPNNGSGPHPKRPHRFRDRLGMERKIVP